MSLYTISDEDIDAVVRYLAIFHPENATAEYARAMLTSFQDALKQLAANSPDDIEKLYLAYEASLDDKSKT